jgi:hypothetical protein
MPKASIIYPTSVVNAKNNGGYHPLGKRAYRSAVKLIYDCLFVYREPRLYHLCFQGQTNKKHKARLQSLVQKIDRAGMPCEWFSARETDSEKGEHLHVFMLIDSGEVRAQSILNGFEDQFLGRECLKRGILLHINPPRNAIHGNNRYAALPYFGTGNRATETGFGRLDDALVWLTYAFKARGKPDVDDKKINGHIFSRSRPNRKRVVDARTVTLPKPAPGPIMISASSNAATVSVEAMRQAEAMMAGVGVIRLASKSMPLAGQAATSRNS